MVMTTFFEAIKPNMNDWGAVRFVVDEASQTVSDSAKLHASKARLELVPMWFAKQLYYMPRDKDGKIIAAGDEFSYWEATGDQDSLTYSKQTHSNHIMSDLINPTFDGEVIKLGPLQLNMQVTYQGIAAIEAAADEAAAADTTSDDGRYLFIGLDLKEPEKSAELTYKLHAVIGEEIISSEPITVADSAKLTWEPETYADTSSELDDRRMLSANVPSIDSDYSLRALSDYQAYASLIVEFRPDNNYLHEVSWNITPTGRFYKAAVDAKEHPFDGYEHLLMKLPKRLFSTARGKRDKNLSVGPLFNSDNRDDTYMLFVGADAGDGSRDSFFLISLVELTPLDSQVYSAELLMNKSNQNDSNSASYSFHGELTNNIGGAFGAVDTFLAIPKREGNGELQMRNHEGKELPVYQRVDLTAHLTHTTKAVSHLNRADQREAIFSEDFMLRRHLLPLGGILFK